MALMSSVLSFSVIAFLLSVRTADSVDALSKMVTAAIPNYNEGMSDIKNSQASIEISQYAMARNTQTTYDVLVLFVDLFQNLTAQARA